MKTSDKILYTRISPATLLIAAPSSFLKSYIGNHIFFMYILDDNNNTVGVQNFTINVIDCLTVWEPSQATIFV